MTKRDILFLLFAITLRMAAQSPTCFGEAQWIGAITRQQANIPKGRHYTGGILKQTRALWNAADTLSRRSIYIARNFQLKKRVAHATVQIAGLGCYKLSINRRTVGDAEFSPAWSDYDKTVFYNTYEVDTCLQRGMNTVQVLLGNGFYNE